MIWFAILIAITVGYTLGRIQPYDRLAEWTNWELRFHLDRWQSRPRQVALFALLLITDPVNLMAACRRRDDPEPKPGPIVIRRVNRDEEPRP